MRPICLLFARLLNVMPGQRRQGGTLVNPDKYKENKAAGSRI